MDGCADQVETLDGNNWISEQLKSTRQNFKDQGSESLDGWHFMTFGEVTTRLKTGQR